MAIDPRIFLTSTEGPGHSRGIDQLTRGVTIATGRKREDKRNEVLDAQTDRQIKVAEDREKRAGQKDLAEIERLGLKTAMERYSADLHKADFFLRNDDVAGAREVIADRQIDNIGEKKRNRTLNTGHTSKLLSLSFDDPEKFASTIKSELHGLNRAQVIPDKTQFGGQEVFKDENDNLFFGTTTRNPKTEDINTVLKGIGHDEKQVGKLSRVSSLGQTAEEKITSAVSQTQQTEDIKTEELREREKIKQEEELAGKPRTEARVRAVAQAASRSEKAFEKVDKVRVNVANLDEALVALRSGAGTGPILSILPSFFEASVKLDASAGRLGLDVVQATTFGALSKGELDLSTTIALPRGLNEEALEKWLVNRIDAETKKAEYLENQAIFLSETDENGDPHTQADWVKKERAAMNAALEAGGITEEDIDTTMKAHGMSRSGVLTEIRRRFESGS